MKKEYSICITHRNNKPTLVQSLESVLTQIDEKFEVVVVDSESNDGSLDILRRYQAEGRITLVIKKCTKGRGRQLAFEHSTGRNIISNIDMDEVYAPKLGELVLFFEKFTPNKILLVTSSLEKPQRETQFITMGSRETFSMLGGWRDLNHTEDWELWRRAASKEKFGRTGFRLITTVNYHPEHRKFTTRSKLRFQRYCEMIRINRYVFGDEKRIGLSQRVFYLLAKIATLFSDHIDNDQDPLFDAYDQKYSIEIRHD